MVILSEWWLFYLSGGRANHCRHIPAHDSRPLKFNDHVVEIYIGLHAESTLFI